MYIVENVAYRVGKVSLTRWPKHLFRWTSSRRNEKGDLGNHGTNIRTAINEIWRAVTFRRETWTQ